MNKYLWRGKYYHHGKTDHTKDMFERLNNAYFEIMKEAEFEKIEAQNEREIMRIAEEG